MVTDEELTDPTYLQWLLDAINKLKKNRTLACLDRILNVAQKEHQNWSRKSISHQLELAVREGKVLTICNSGVVSYRNSALSQKRRFTVTPFTDLFKIIGRSIRELGESNGSQIEDIERYIHASHVLTLEDGADFSYLLKTSVEKAVRLGKLLREDCRLKIAEAEAEQADTGDTQENEPIVNQLLHPTSHKKMSKNQITNFFKSPLKEISGSDSITAKTPHKKDALDEPVKTSDRSSVTGSKADSQNVSDVPSENKGSSQKNKPRKRKLANELGTAVCENKGGTQEIKENYVNKTDAKIKGNDFQGASMMSYEEYLKQNSETESQDIQEISPVEEVEKEKSAQVNGLHNCSEDKVEEISFADFLRKDDPAGILLDENTKACNAAKVNKKSEKSLKLSKSQTTDSKDDAVKNENLDSLLNSDSERGDTKVINEGETDLKESSEECNKEQKTKSAGIAKFFSKVDKNTSGKNSNSNSQSVVVRADVHSPSSSPSQESRTVKVFSIFDRRKTGSSDSTNDVKEQNKFTNSETNVIVNGKKLDTIDHLASEIIEIPDENEKSTVQIVHDANSKETVQNNADKKKSDLDKLLVESTAEEHEVMIVDSVDSEDREEHKAKMKAKLDALNDVKVPVTKNVMQATLNFSKSGLKVTSACSAKKAPEVTNCVGKDDEQSGENSKLEVHEQLAQKTKPVIKKRKVRSPIIRKNSDKSENKSEKSDRINEKESDESETVTDQRLGLRRSTRNRPQENALSSQIDLDKSSNDFDTDTPCGKKQRKVKYAATIINEEKCKKFSPIRIRFTRLRSPRDNSSKEFTSKSLRPKEKKKQAKLSRAQELLQKAKGKKQKRKEKVKAKKEKHVIEEISADSSNLRRSTRRTAQPVYDENLIVCEDSDSNSSLQPSKTTRKTKKQTPTKTPKTVKNDTAQKSKPAVEKSKPANKKSPKKSTPRKALAVKGKLAPIFQKTKQKSSADNSDDVQIVQVQLDPEAQRVRQAFLFSGVPDAIRKQTAVIADNANKVADYPPIPSVSHVQQIPSQYEQFWDQSNFTLNLRNIPDKPVCLKNLEMGELTDCLEKSEISRYVTDGTRTQSKLFSEEIARYLLSEASLSNPVFPVFRTYRHLLSKNKSTEQENSSSLQQDGIGEGLSKKRKADENGEMETGRNTKRRKESTEVIEIGSPETTEREAVKGRRSLRRANRSKDSTVDENKPVESQDKPKDNVNEISADSKGHDLMWTEKYQPSNGNEVLGNSAAVKKLRNWLVEWKQLTDREARKQRKLLLKQAKKEGRTKAEDQASNEWWTDDDSDFDLSSSDEDSDYKSEDGMCNTMLITGPSGSGKTASVYALAQELGYKVFEVNGSSRRSGRQILAQLQEATQSHQVARNNLDSTFTTFMQMAAKEKSPKGGKKKPEKLPTAFSNLFNKAGKKSDTVTTVTSKKAGRSEENKSSQKRNSKVQKASEKGKDKITKHNEGKTEESSAVNKGLNLTSTSLILFEEVDIVFEEDKGFWAAIQTFMSITKKPIILTVNDPNFKDQFEGHFENLTFKLPSQSHIASLLQVVCLVEKLRTDYQDVLRLVNMNKGDLRRSMLSLQYWAESGGGAQCVEQPVRYNKDKLNPEGQAGLSTPNAKLTRVMKINSSMVASPAKDSADEFEVIPQTKRRRFNRILDDESSMDSMPGTPVKYPGGHGNKILDKIAEDGSQELGSGVESGDCTVNGNIGETSGPVIHCKVMESVSGVGSLMCADQNLLKVLQATGVPVSSEKNLKKFDVLCLLENVRPDIMCSNLHHFVKLPLVVSSDLTLKKLRSEVNVKVKPARRRIIQSDDLYDSEASNDGLLSSSQTAGKGGDKDNTSSVLTSVSGTVNVDDQHCHNNTKHSTDISAGERILHKSMMSLSQMYDTLSFADCYLRYPSVYAEGPCGQMDFRYSSAVHGEGLDDKPASHDEKNWWKHNIASEIRSHVQFRSVNQCNETFDAVMNKANDLPQTERLSCTRCLSIPVSKDSSRGLLLCGQSTEQRSLAAVNKKCLSSISNSLPLHVHRNMEAVTMDYTSTLRLICKSEQFREATHAKRRFFHYLDSISLPLKQSAIDVLCSSFT